MWVDRGRASYGGWSDMWGCGRLGRFVVEGGIGVCTVHRLDVELCQPSLEFPKRWWVPLLLMLGGCSNCAGEEAEFVGIC